MMPHRKIVLMSWISVYYIQDWFETNLWHKKPYSEGGQKIGGCRGPLGRVVVDLAFSLINYHQNHIIVK